MPNCSSISPAGARDVRRAFRRRIARAIPTCTLWRPDDYLFVMRFRLWPRWSFTFEEIQNA